MTDCSTDGCLDAARKRGMCELHYRRWFRANRANPCAVDGCDRPVVARGWCQGHYMRWRDHGDPGSAEWQNDGSVARAKCLDCDRKVGSKGGKGRCPRCRNKLEVAEIVARRVPCAVVGCTRFVRARATEYCPMHRYRLRHWGDLGPAERVGKAIDHTGQRFSRWLVIERVLPDRGGYAMWRCQCDCGTEAVIHSGSLRSGNSQSCGCLARERRIARSTTHGHTAGRNFHPLYATWAGIKQRTGDPNSSNYPRWGGRGIKMYEPWQDDFARFLADILADIGERPPNPPGWTGRQPCYSLDRVDNDGNYEPGNLRWATHKMQADNSRNVRRDLETAEIVKLYEQGLDVVAISEQLDCGHNTVCRRLRAAGVAFRPRVLPLDVSQLRALRAQGLTYKAIADHMGCSKRTVWLRLQEPV